MPGTSAISVVKNVGYGGGTAVDSVYRMTLTGWDDTLAHGEDPLKFKLYMLVAGVYYTITDNTFLTDFYYRIPIMLNDPTDTS